MIECCVRYLNVNYSNYYHYPYCYHYQSHHTTLLEIKMYAFYRG